MSNTILRKELVSPDIYRYRIHTPKIAKKRLAGQFVILRPVPIGERIPLTIADANAKEGWIEIIFQVVGKTTLILSTLNEGDRILDLAGPLGQPTHIEKFGKCVCIGGGVGVAPLFPIIGALTDVGNDVTSIIGARSKGLLMLENEVRARSAQTFVATDDGSYGHKGFVSDVFNKLVADGIKFDLAVVIGPVIMMKVVSRLTVAAGVKTVASLNPIMIDGTGMCGGCRVTVHGLTKFACVDGPEFDAAGIDWDELVRRLNSYKFFEGKSLADHRCVMATA